MEHSGRTRTLLRALGDSNRQVRIRAASTLARMESELPQIVENAIAMHDNYALQALLSELDASESLENVAKWLERSSNPSFASAALKEITELAKKHTGEKIKVAAATAGGQ